MKCVLNVIRTNTTIFTDCSIIKINFKNQNMTYKYTILTNNNISNATAVATKIKDNSIKTVTISYI